MDVHSSLELKNNNFLFYVHTTFYYYYSFLLSFSFLHVSPLTTSPSLLSSSTNPQTLLSSSETHRWSAQAQPPQTRRHWPTFGCRLTHFGLSSLFLAFRFYVSSCACVSGCACISAFVFRACLCFKFVFWAGFLYQAWVSIFVFGWVCVSGCDFSAFFFFLLHWFWWAQRGCGCAVIFMGLMVIVVVCW